MRQTLTCNNLLDRRTKLNVNIHVHVIQPSSNIYEMFFRCYETYTLFCLLLHGNPVYS